MATEHRGLQKPRDCCGHRLEHPLSRAHPEESTDKFFPPGSPPTPDTQRTDKAGDLGIHGNLRPQHGASISKTTRGQNAGAWQWGAVLRAVSPQTEQRRGCLCVELSGTLPSVPEPGALKCTLEPLYFTQRAASGQGALRGPSCFAAHSGDNRGQP